MITIDNIKSVYFLGIGGIGMSAIARYFNYQKIKVSGYDKTPTILTHDLETEGVEICYIDDSALLPEKIDLCVYTPAVPKDLSLLLEIKKRGIPLMKRSQVLGLIVNNGNTIAVAGTHGKTSTTSLITHLLKTDSAPVNAFIGGIAANYNTNLLLSDTSSLFVVEADEFDRSFLTLHPKSAVITSVDADHLDIYGNTGQLLESFVDFSKQVSDFLLVKDHTKVNFNNCQTYSLNNQSSSYYAENIDFVNECYQFDLVTPAKKYLKLKLNIGGLHNVENAIAASALALNYGITEDSLRRGLSTFKGVHRRFEMVIKNQNLIFIDDYAHHPTEIKACLSSIRQMYPNRKITAVFQPHLYSRTRDFADDFASSLSLADELVLLDIYPARELPMEGVTSKWLLSKVEMNHKYLVSKDNLTKLLYELNPELIVTMGAGDIDRLIPEVKSFFMHHLKILSDE